MTETAEAETQVNNVKPTRIKDKKMKKNMLVTMTVTAALLAGASLAKADAYLEIGSGSSWANTYSATPGVTLTATVGTWQATYSSGNSYLAPSTFDLQISSPYAAAQTTPLYVVLSVEATGGGPPVGGSWVLETTDNGTHPTLNIGLYKSPLIYSVADSVAPPLLTGLTQFKNDPDAGIHDQIISGTVSGMTYYTEVIEVMPQGKSGVLPSIDSTLTLPDGGLTIAMLGSVLIGVAGIRAKLGKRS